jgi:hypothetical protein
MEFSLRLKAAGLRTLLAPDVRCDYYARTNPADYLRHNFVNGQWAILPFVHSDVIPVSLRHLIPLVFALAVLCGLAAAPWSLIPLALAALPYGIANLAASANVALGNRKLSYLFLMPLVFAGLHLGYGLGSIAGVIEAAAIRLGQIRWKEKSCIPQP